jgi:hypothetical protein
MTEFKLNKAQQDLLRFAFLEHETGTASNSLVISPVRTKGNATKRANVEFLQSLGLVKGSRPTESGLALGRSLHEAVTDARRNH